MKRRRLLVIDDDPSVLFAFRKLFRNSSVIVDTSECLDEAKELIDKHVYNVIITDLAFSETVKDAGIEISCYARQKLPQVKIILWTASDTAGISDKARQAKIDICLMKPVSPCVLQGLVENIANVHSVKRKGKTNEPVTTCTVSDQSSVNEADLVLASFVNV